MSENYNVIILGGGPAGLTAAIYGGRSRLRTLLVERGLVGGQIAMAERVDNFPGFPQGISGAELGELMLQQATRFGLETLYAEVIGVRLEEGWKIAQTSQGEYRSRALIIALGARHRHLGVPGEAEFLGKGVSYCATCDAPFFSDQLVAVVGGGNTAVTDALYLTKFARRVYLIHRRRQLRAEALLQEMALAHEKIELVWDTVVERIAGGETVTELHLRRVDKGGHPVLPVSGVFIGIGTIPNSEFLGGVAELSQDGHIITNNMMETSVPGLFAAGDVRLGAVEQAISAAGDGAVAAIAAVGYLQDKRSPKLSSARS